MHSFEEELLCLAFCLFPVHTPGFISTSNSHFIMNSELDLGFCIVLINTMCERITEKSSPPFEEGRHDSSHLRNLARFNYEAFTNPRSSVWQLLGHQPSKQLFVWSTDPSDFSCSWDCSPLQQVTSWELKSSDQIQGTATTNWLLTEVRMTQLEVHQQLDRGKKQDIVPDSNTQMLDTQDRPAPPLNSLCSVTVPGAKPTNPKSL